MKEQCGPIKGPYQYQRKPDLLLFIYVGYFGIKNYFSIDGLFGKRNVV